MFYVLFCLIWSCWLLNKCVFIVIFSFIGNKWMILNEDLETEMFWSKWLKYQRPTLPFRLSKSGPLLLTRLRSRTIFNTLSCKTDQWDSTLPSQYSNTNLQSLSFLRFFFYICLVVKYLMFLHSKWIKNELEFLGSLGPNFEL